MEYNGIRVTKLHAADFTARLPDGTRVLFKAMYTHGVYSKISCVVRNDRGYTADRYHRKYNRTIEAIAYELLKAGLLWDFENRCLALESHKSNIRRKYERCKAFGMEIDDWTVKLMEGGK